MLSTAISLNWWAFDCVLWIGDSTLYGHAINRTQTLVIIDISGNFINQTTPKWTIQNLFRNSNLYPASAPSIPNQASCYVNEFIHRNHSVNCAGMVEWDIFECPATNRILLLNFMQTPHGGGNIIYFCRRNYSLFLYTLTKSRRTLLVPGQFLGDIPFLNGNEWLPLRTSFVINFRFWREALFPLTTTTNCQKNSINGNQLRKSQTLYLRLTFYGHRYSVQHFHFLLIVRILSDALVNPSVLVHHVLQHRLTRGHRHARTQST